MVGGVSAPSHGFDSHHHATPGPEVRFYLDLSWTRVIDDILFAMKIPHIKEPKYPQGNYRGDFKASETIIEYCGLSGNNDYDEKMDVKKAICKEHGISMLLLYPEDLLSSVRLERKLSKALII